MDNHSDNGITGSDRDDIVKAQAALVRAQAAIAEALTEDQSAPAAMPQSSPLASERDAPAAEARTSLVVVDWEFANGLAGHRICTDPDAARMAALGIIDAHPDARVWLAGVQVQQGFIASDDRSRGMTCKQYLGDAVYADFDAGPGVLLTTNDGISDTNTIYLEPAMLDALFEFLNRLSDQDRSRA